MTDLRILMPAFARHEGIWEGTYRYVDASGTTIDEHASRLVCRIVPGHAFPYHQTNHYRWADGRTEVRDFPASFRDGRLWFDNELISGWAAEVPLDQFHRSVMLYWVRRDDPATYLYEMIQLSDCGRYRTRVWQWIRAGQCWQRTLIDERKVAEDWTGH